MKKKIGSALVVGSGIGGIRSALDLAETGYRVTMIDRSPHLGGVLSQLDYQFPTDHCGMCKMLPMMERDNSSQYCLRKGLFHENIDIMLSTELIRLEGEPGKYLATLRQRPTLVDQDLCIGCGECARVCPVEVPDLFNAGLTKRKAVYLPVPHNIPNSYVVDTASCTMCGKCEEACPTGAIDFQMDARKAFRILIVDDEFVVRDSLKEWLVDEGFQVITAESGSQALEKLSGEEIHMMLLDIKMPGMDGVEVLKRAKSLDPELPVVMMTAYATVETAVEAMKIGALDYLMKPFDPDSLVPMVIQLYQNISRTGEKSLEVGALVLSTGFESYDPLGTKNSFGYGELPNVVTSLEFERMISGTGLYEGRLLRPSDGKEVRRAAWIQCVGSRDRQINAGFCSSVCCMFSIKEALLAKEKSEGLIDTSIFYIDMRTFGKEFQRYRDQAEKEQGVRFRRGRVHSVEPSDEEGDLRLIHVDMEGRRQEEDFDLVVLATGQRAAEGTQKLAEMTGLELNQYGFCRTEGLSESMTSMEGIFSGGSFSGLRDISESVIQANSASLEASRLIHSKGGGLAEETGSEGRFRDVSRELPRVMVVLCTCGNSLTEACDSRELTEWLEEDGGADQTLFIERLCTREGWERLANEVKEGNANRLLISACMPYVYTRKIRELGEAVGLDPSLMDAVDIRTPAFPDRNRGRDQIDRDIRSAISMGIGRLKRMDPLPASSRRIIQKALVVGGGIAGMTSALAIADHGFGVSLVEREGELGGNLRALHRTIDGTSPEEILEDTVSRLEKHPNIQVYLNAGILHSRGRVGNFSTAIIKEDGEGETLEHGVTILATGGTEAETKSFGYGRSKDILTQRELEARLADSTVDPSRLTSLAMIQCVDSREEPRNYCSRVCCTAALKNALYIKEKNPEADIFIFYRDIMTPGFLEAYYTEARRSGIVFIPYEKDKKPEVEIEKGRPVVIAKDLVLGREIRISPDLLILSTGIVPNDVNELAGLFGVELDRDGFYKEAESKWRPVDFIKEGLFMCGIGHSPRSIRESIATGEAAAVRALRILNNERMASSAVIATVRHSLCSLCEKCIEACPYDARRLSDEGDRIELDELMCQGCGSCAEVCPNSASVLMGYRDQQVFDIIEAALE